MKGTAMSKIIDDEEMTHEEHAKMWEEMREELGGPKARFRCGQGRKEALFWRFAYCSGQTVAEFSKANWWARAGFGCKVLRVMLWVPHKYGRPEVKTKADFLKACQGNFFSKYRDVGHHAVKSALATLGYERARARCPHCGEYIADRGGEHQLDLYEVTKAAQ